MTDRGTKWLHHPFTWLGWMQRHYPWSVLWILFMVGVAVAVAGRWIPTTLIILLITIVALHSIRVDNQERKNSQRKV